MVQGKYLVSIVMATHNGSRFIGEAVVSVLEQTYKNFEFIIVDNASTDGTMEVINRFSDQRIRVFHNKTNLGLTKSLNGGIKLARGKYIARIDDDDVWSDLDKLAKQIELMESDEGLGVCGTQNIVVDEGGQELYRLHYGVMDHDIREKMLRGNQLPHSSVLVRRAALDQVGFYDENYRYAQDFELWLRIGRCYKLANLPDVYIKQRINPDGVTSRKNMQQFLSFLKIAYKYRREYPGFWQNTPVYLREFVLNLLPKPMFYRLGGWRRKI